MTLMQVILNGVKGDTMYQTATMLSKIYISDICFIYL